ncbi:unnamed protein product [Gongylonema pulchrum]|uniref:NR LBD domain-containing protein n=1 Tax=Gongylonema pulchrum TaxID=637853 RepID=A0A183CWX4_9BILA|nr:unnamed protein product [Gongylonema pulchrum]
MLLDTVITAGGNWKELMCLNFHSSGIAVIEGPMISYYGSGSFFLDQQAVEQLIIQLKNSDVDDFRAFLRLMPPISQLIRSIPHTLTLLDVIVTKSLKFHKSNSNKAALHYHELFNQLLWWIAYNEQKRTTQNEHSKVSSTRAKLIDITSSDLSLAHFEVIIYQYIKSYLLGLLFPWYCNFQITLMYFALPKVVY